MAEKPPLTDRMEDCLEAFRPLEDTHKAARSKDIAECFTALLRIG